ncbi:hypothetical protein Pst134EA_009340 [Puccinia striiformis f. sp. tritici]|uniref:hypothetical protein n=1 Tax=Puccinia striiformis f. sp. tritici TaxID=168172 RepID=UPI0020085277|nr:hypothetical protein Pst134EA_009340 [Puccinia striiformis f. sp. tritici]KAH9468809.1 hypothetical protein Pst134EA_009340 [Puccinia striiformis f. sp. tritici]
MYSRRQWVAILAPGCLQVVRCMVHPGSIPIEHLSTKAEETAMTIHNSANMGSTTEFSSGGGLFRFEDFDFRRQPDVPVSDSDRLATLFKTQSRMEDPIGESQTLTGSTLRESQTVTRPTMDHQLHYLNRQAAEFGAQMSQRYSEIARSELISNILADLEHLRRIHEMIAGSRGKPMDNPMNEGVILTVFEPAKTDPSYQKYNLLERLTRGQRLRSKKEERTSENLDGMLSKSQGRELDKPAKVRGPGGTSEKSLLRELLDKSKSRNQDSTTVCVPNGGVHVPVENDISRSSQAIHCNEGHPRIGFNFDYQTRKVLN